MKKYKKDGDGFFVCEECGITYEGMNNFSRHIGLYHNKKIYFDKWIKENFDDKCIICGNETMFSGKLNLGYSSFCSRKCALESKRIGFEKGMMKKYGTVIPMCISSSRQKYVNTMINRYGVSVPAKNKDISNKILKSMNIKYREMLPCKTRKYLINHLKPE